MAFTVTLILIMLAVVGLAVREIRLFLRKRDDYPLRRLTLRMSSALMLLFLLGSILVGIHVFHLDAPRGLVGIWVAFWGCIALLAGAVICLTIADLKLIGADTQDTTRQIWREIAELIATHEQHRHTPSSDDPPGHA